jgi:hypothetical protein
MDEFKDTFQGAYCMTLLGLLAGTGIAAVSLLLIGGVKFLWGLL